MFMKVQCNSCNFAGEVKNIVNCTPTFFVKNTDYILFLVVKMVDLKILLLKRKQAI